MFNRAVKFFFISFLIPCSFQTGPQISQKSKVHYDSRRKKLWSQNYVMINADGCLTVSYTESSLALEHSQFQKIKEPSLTNRWCPKYGQCTSIMHPTNGKAILPEALKNLLQISSPCTLGEVVQNKNMLGGKSG